MASLRLVLAAVVGLLIVPLAAGLSDKGVVYLDDLTFDKLVNGRDHVFVRFDKEYPWGDEHDMFKELAEEIGAADAPLLVAGVPISNREEYLVNPRLARRYGVDKVKEDDFPVLKLFVKGSDPKKPLDYKGAMTMGALVTWLKQHTGLFIGKKGQLQSMDEAARRFMASAPAARAASLDAAKSDATALDVAPNQKEFVEFYVRVMQRVVEKGESYVIKESERLSKMAADKSVAAAKREAFEWKLNILESFGAPAAASGSKKTEL